MPYLADGTPVDIVLNPLGVPSRMNIGQILETHLGWAAHGLGRADREMVEQARHRRAAREAQGRSTPTSGVSAAIDEASDEAARRLANNVRRGIHMATAVFDGAKEDRGQGRARARRAADERADGPLRRSHRRALRSDVTVGIIYMLKLHHLADDKIHARSIGPYSLVTQQPLGGKAQFGGQRLGEMEVWALEAYGAAYGLQEFLTVKSDDVLGRTRIYESIVKGENTLEPGCPRASTSARQGAAGPRPRTSS